MAIKFAGIRVVLVSWQLAILEKWTNRIALTGASRPPLPTGETNGSASDLALRSLSPAGRDARAPCQSGSDRGSEGKLTIIKHYALARLIFDHEHEQELIETRGHRITIWQSGPLG